MGGLAPVVSAKQKSPPAAMAQGRAMTLAAAR